MWEQDEVDTNIIEQLRYILSYHIIGSNGDTVQCSSPWLHNLWSSSIFPFLSGCLAVYQLKSEFFKILLS